MESVKLGRNGQLSLPRAAVLPIEMYTPERIREFERATVVDAETRRMAARAVAGKRR